MEQLLCLVSGIDDGILGEFIKRLMRENNIKVMEASAGLNEVLNELSLDDDFLLIGREEKDLPKEYKAIFKKNKEVAVIELLTNGKSLGFYMDDIASDEIVKIIRAMDKRSVIKKS